MSGKEKEDAERAAAYAREEAKRLETEVQRQQRYITQLEAANRWVPGADDVTMLLSF